MLVEVDRSEQVRAAILRCLPRYNGSAAAAEFRKLLDHRGIVLNFPFNQETLRTKVRAARIGYVHLRNPAAPHKVDAWPHSRKCSKQRPDACGQRHGERTPERDAYCTYRHSCATRACGQPAEKREE
jgi:hypothetical protein